MRAVLVTGGCGFIGSHFVRRVLDETSWRVVNLDKLTYAGHRDTLADVADGPRYRFVQGDIADRDQVNKLLAEERPGAIVNFAAESHVDRSILDAGPFLHTNVTGVQVLLEAARHHRVDRFVQISTDETYGDAEGHEPFDEVAALHPSSPYAASKAAADLLCLAHARTYGLPVIIVRSTNNYGPYQFPEKLIPLMIRNALHGLELPVYGDGRQRRDWLHVADNVDAILRVLQQGRPGAIYNVATGTERTNLEVVEEVCRAAAAATGVTAEALLQRISFVPDRPGHDRRYALRSERIRSELGWEPRVEFSDGLARTVRWYVNHAEWVSRVISEEYRSYYDAVHSRTWNQIP